MKGASLETLLRRAYRYPGGRKAKRALLRLIALTKDEPSIIGSLRAEHLRLLAHAIAAHVPTKTKEEKDE